MIEALGRLRGTALAIAALACAVVVLSTALTPPAVAQAPPSALGAAGSGAAGSGGGDTKPYDEKLLRLSEVLGAIHFLRELCGGTDGMVWRDRMRELIDAEATSAARRLQFTRAFNTGYRGYSRAYSTCTQTARTTIDRFVTEGVEIADSLMVAQP